MEPALSITSTLDILFSFRILVSIYLIPRRPYRTVAHAELTAMVSAAGVQKRRVVSQIDRLSVVAHELRSSSRRVGSQTLEGPRTHLTHWARSRCTWRITVSRNDGSWVGQRVPGIQGDRSKCIRGFVAPAGTPGFSALESMRKVALCLPPTGLPAFS
jgi:hypothetical protein